MLSGLTALPQIHLITSLSCRRQTVPCSVLRPRCCKHTWKLSVTNLSRSN